MGHDKHGEPITEAKAAKKGLFLSMTDPNHPDAVVPDWFYLIRAARYLGVPPWELATQPFYWTEWALIAHDTEIEVQNELQRRATIN